MAHFYGMHVNLNVAFWISPVVSTLTEEKSPSNKGNLYILTDHLLFPPTLLTAKIALGSWNFGDNIRKSLSKKSFAICHISIMYDCSRHLCKRWPGQLPPIFSIYRSKKQKYENKFHLSVTMYGYSHCFHDSRAIFFQELQDGHD